MFDNYGQGLLKSISKSTCVIVFCFDSDNQSTRYQGEFQMFSLFSGRHMILED